MPGKYRVTAGNTFPNRTGRFRLVYVGSVENFYGRMLCLLIEKVEATSDLKIVVVGPNADWPKELLDRARARGTYIGFKPPEEAAEALASADALLVVMSFEKEHEVFMRTSFTTKFLDYVAFGKPVILWGPEYCEPVRVSRKHGGAAVVSTDDAGAVISLCRQIAVGTVEMFPQTEMLDLVLVDGHAKGIITRNLVTGKDRSTEKVLGEIENLVAARANQ